VAAHEDSDVEEEAMHHPPMEKARMFDRRRAGVVRLAVVVMVWAAPVWGAPTDRCPSNSPTSNAAAIVNLSIDGTDVVSSRWDDGTVSLAIPLDNRGNTPARNLTIQSVQGPPSSRYLGPLAVPYHLGDIAPGEFGQVAAQFAMSALRAHAKYPLLVQGTYQFGTAVCPFTAQTFVPEKPPSNGGTPKFTTPPVGTFTAETAFYPDAPLPHPDILPNAEVTEQKFLLPLGPARNLFATPPVPRVLDVLNPSGDVPPQGVGPEAFVLLRNTQVDSTTVVPPDPSTSGAAPNGFVMVTFNTAVSFSLDYGHTFTTVNLTGATGFKDPAQPARKDFFPENDGGLCCDQVVLYIPERNLLVWVLQYWSPSVNVLRPTGTFGGFKLVQATGQNRLRIAYSAPDRAAADFLHAWRWFDLTPQNWSITTITDWLDQPDLAYSHSYLYLGVSHGFFDFDINDTTKQPIGPQVHGSARLLARLSLDDMVNRRPVAISPYEALGVDNLVRARFVQSAPDAMYYAAQTDSSTLYVFADPDGSESIPSPQAVPVSSFCMTLPVLNGPWCSYATPAPDGLNWNVGSHTVLGGTYVAPGFLCPPEGCATPTRFLYFAFDAGRDFSRGRPFPYVRVVKLDADTLTLINEIDIWNPAFAFALPALVWQPGSGQDEVAFSLVRGGPTKYADNAVGFLNDNTLHVTTASDVTQTDGNGVVRYGDYFNVRNSVGAVTLFGEGVGYATAAYSMLNSLGKPCTKGVCQANVQYILFGRFRDLFPNLNPDIQ
jgi:hypothetical protein